MDSPVYRLRLNKLLESDASKHNIVSAWSYLISNSREDDSLIFYFSGFGENNSILCYDSIPFTETVLAIEDLINITLPKKLTVLFIFDANINPSDIDFNKFEGGNIGILFATDGKHKAIEHKFKINEKDYSSVGVLTYCLSKCLREYKKNIPVILLPELLKVYFDSLIKPYNAGSESRIKQSPYFWCSKTFEMFIPVKKEAVQFR